MIQFTQKLALSCNTSLYRSCAELIDGLSTLRAA